MFVEDGAVVDCRECVYGKKCSTASAHGYCVGYCGQFEPISSRMTGETFTEFLRDFALDGTALTFKFDTLMNTIRIECYDGKRFRSHSINNRVLERLEDPDEMLKTIITRLKGELKE